MASNTTLPDAAAAHHRNPLTVEARVSAAGEISCSFAASCPRCARGEGCGQAAWFAPRLQSIRLAMPTGSFAPDTKVTLLLPATRFLRATMLAYGLPLAGLTGGALAGQFIGGELFAVGGSLIGVAAAWLLARALATHGAARLLPELQELQELQELPDLHGLRGP